MSATSGRGQPSIVLARHGRPDLPADLARPISGRDIGRWYERYDRLGIAADDMPAALREALAAAPCVVTSDARRAIETAARAVDPDRVRIEPGLGEVSFPASISMPVRLSPNTMVLLARAFQMARWCACDEPVPATRARAATAAATLSRLAEAHGWLVFVGHGWFNRFVARELRRHGWRGPQWLPTGYWSTATYTRSGASGDSPRPASCVAASLDHDLRGG